LRCEEEAIEAKATTQRIAGAVRNAKKCQRRVDRLNCRVSGSNSWQDGESIQDVIGELAR
jgi:hypothetical protein